MAQRLGEIHCPDEFGRTLLTLIGPEASNRSASYLKQLLRGASFEPGQVAAATEVDHWPPPGWAIARSISTSAAPELEWIWIGEKRFTEPFHEDTMQLYRNRPLNRLVRFRTKLQALVERSAAEDARAPDGFIFHMSRCGSTLLAQMLAQLPEHIVLSEPEPLDAVIRSAMLNPGSVGATALQATVKALAHARVRAERLFIKLDAWHMLALPILSKAFPTVPWVFLYRDPAEVLASHVHKPGVHMVPGLLPAGLLGMASSDSVPQHQYGASVLERICSAALRDLDPAVGLLVNYSELHAGIPEHVLRHFGMEPSAIKATTMARATAFHSKTGLPFSGAFSPREDPSRSTGRADAPRLLSVFRRLEATRKKAAQGR